MRLSQVNPELRPAYRFVRTTPVGHPGLVKLARVALPLIPHTKAPAGVRLETVAQRGAGDLRVYTPDSGGSGAAVLWIHGGGLVIGAASQDDGRCFTIARDLDVVVVSVDYRLAPEYPFPTPLEDCRQAWQWLQQHSAERGIDPARVAVGGQSAGGGLAAGLVQRLHDDGGVQPAAQWLFCPMLDDRTAGDRALDRIGHLLWDNRANRVGWQAYLGAAPGSPEVPVAAVPARRTDFSGLPPAWIGTGDIELFHAENLAYAASLRAAGVACVLDVVPGAPHAFETVAPHTAVARAYWQRSLDWLTGQLADGHQG